ncbi:hypothetical protein FOL47_003004 [Perkinsus chesapeaki]|uniref:UBC core domain-containing protein n=1 Tax=Perkinsus chesapeaki TaxID=330153 RepID=A0A7J6MZW5_PERCH|nr:hypothetical protein FOL47_003004 [Perkinsus chesapeaki]
MELSHAEWSAKVGEKRPPKQHEILVHALKAPLVDTRIKYARGSHSPVVVLAPLLFIARLVSSSSLYSSISAPVLQWLSILTFFLALWFSVTFNNCHHYRLQRSLSAPFRCLILAVCLIELMHSGDLTSSLGAFEMGAIALTALLLVIDIIIGDVANFASRWTSRSSLEVLSELPGKVFLCRRLGSHSGLPQGAGSKSQLVAFSVSSKIIGTQLASSPPADLCIVACIEGALVELTPLRPEYLRKLSDACRGIIMTKTESVPPVVRIVSTETFTATGGQQMADDLMTLGPNRRLALKTGITPLEETSLVSSSSSESESSEENAENQHSNDRDKCATDKLANTGAQSSVRAIRRMAAEAKEMQKNAIEGVSAHPASQDSLLEWVGYINGPNGTPYESGSFVIDIDIPVDYPFKPPRMRFRTPIWHPNITGDGRGKICMDILKAEHWSALLTLQTVLLSLVSLLADPNTGDPLNVEASDELEHFPEIFEAKAKEWTSKYASHRKVLLEQGKLRHVVVSQGLPSLKAIELTRYRVAEAPLARELRTRDPRRLIWKVEFGNLQRDNDRMPSDFWTAGWMTYSELFALWILTGNLDWRGTLKYSIEKKLFKLHEQREKNESSTNSPARPQVAESPMVPGNSGNHARTSAALTREAATAVAGVVRGGAARHAGALAAFGVEAVVFAREESAGRRVSGEISEHTHIANVSKAGISASSRALGSLAGCGLGQAALPIPIVGAVVGGLIGGLAGGELSNSLTRTAMTLTGERTQTSESPGNTHVKHAPDEDDSDLL